MVQMDYAAEGRSGFHGACERRLSPRRPPAYPSSVRSLTRHFRQALAALIVGVLMLASAAPCTAVAAPGRTAIAAPADPCRAHHAAPAPACAQLACQQAADLSSPFSAPAVFPSAAAFSQALAIAHGRTDAPPLPPPRNLL
jgi:hypothetical protein